MAAKAALKFDNRVAVVTGAAGNIGLATVKLFAELGVKVAATDLSEELVAVRVKPLVDAGLDVRAYAQNVTDRDSVFSAFDRIVADFGKIDIAVNNAGVWEHRDVLGQQRFEEMPVAEWKRVMDIDLDGMFHCLQAELKLMAPRGYGRIVNLGSIAGEAGLPGFADYAACKAAVIMLTKTLAMENATRGITVNSVSPGMITKEIIKCPGTWLGRSGLSDDIARAIVFLASDTSDYMTGVDLPVEGGRILGPHGMGMKD